MGCSAGLISIDLAKDLLKVHPNTYALVVSTENITLNWYRGEEKVLFDCLTIQTLQSMLIPNTLFRVGGAAILLSNHKQKKVLMKLRNTVRTHKGMDDECFQSVVQDADSAGYVGVRLSKNVMSVAGKALKSNITVS